MKHLYQLALAALLWSIVLSLTDIAKEPLWIKIIGCFCAGYSTGLLHYLPFWKDEA